MNFVKKWKINFTNIVTTTVAYVQLKFGKWMYLVIDKVKFRFGSMILTELCLLN